MSAGFTLDYQNASSEQLAIEITVLCETKTNSAQAHLASLMVDELRNRHSHSEVQEFLRQAQETWDMINK